METKTIIVDCDAGTDDALALIILFAAHKYRKINVKAVTCVYGNTTLNNVITNVFRTMEVCKIDDIPVYKGSYSPLLNTKNAADASSECHHGIDGFGDVYDEKPDTSKLMKDHAVYALHKLTSENPDQIGIVCLGPLTNVALAVKLYPTFMNNVKEFFVMGGNSTAQGNITAQAEFNFYADPESAHVVLNNLDKPFWLLPWEACLKSRITHEWRKDILGTINTPCVQMMNKIENSLRSQGKMRWPYYTPCDAILAGIILRHDMAKNVVLWHADVELHGMKTRGQVVLDHKQTNKPNVQLIEDFDSEIFKELLLFAINPSDHNKYIIFQ